MAGEERRAVNCDGLSGAAARRLRANIINGLVLAILGAEGSRAGSFGLKLCEVVGSRSKLPSDVVSTSL